MAIYFFDASAVVKRYVREPGSVWVREICHALDAAGDQQHLITIAEISRVEVAAAFAVLVRRNEISKGLGRRAFEQFTTEIADEYQLVRLTAAMIRDAAELTQRHPLKGFDAVQLATATALRRQLLSQTSDLVFVTGDQTLLQAARAEGLTTANPFDFTNLD